MKTFGFSVEKTEECFDCELVQFIETGGINPYITTSHVTDSTGNTDLKLY